MYLPCRKLVSVKNTSPLPMLYFLMQPHIKNIVPVIALPYKVRSLHVVVAVHLGLLVSQPDTLLSNMRKEVERLYCKPNELGTRGLAENWCFLDSES